MHQAQGTAAPAEVYGLLRDHHLQAMPDYDLALLAARSCGYTNAMIAEQVYKSVRMLSNDMARISQVVCVPVGIEHEVIAVGFWFGMHTANETECSVRAMRWIEDGTLFEVIRARGAAPGEALKEAPDAASKEATKEAAKEAQETQTRAGKGANLAPEASRRKRQSQ